MENLNTVMTFSDEPDLVAEDDYEFVIDNVEKKRSKSGDTDYLSLKLKIRTDVEQPSKGRVLFSTIFRDKDNPQWYDYTALKRLILTQKPAVVQDGKKWGVSFNSCDECIQYLIGINVRARVVHEVFINSNGEEETKAAIDRKSFTRSLAGTTPAPATTTTTTPSPSPSPILDTNDDLPF